MKIVHLMGYFVPELGYQEYYLAKKHKEMGHDVYVIASDLWYPSPGIETMSKEAGANNTSRKRKPGFNIVDGIKVYRLRHFFEYTDFILVKGLKNTLNYIKPDVVFAHESRQGTPALAGLWKKEIGYKYIIDQHDFWHIVKDHGLIMKALRYLEYEIFRKRFVNFAIKSADAIIAVTPESKQFLIQRHGVDKNRIELIKLGVLTERFTFSEKLRAQTRKKYGIKSDEIVLIYSGIIYPRKYLEMLVSAFSKLKTKKQVRLLIVGSGEKNYIKKIKSMAAELDLGKKLVFAGFVNPKNLRNYYSASDIAVWVNNNSISIMEAMACKRPVIIPALQLKELASYDNGYAFTPLSESHLLECMEKLVNDKDLRLRMGLNGYKAVIKNFDYSKIARDFLKIAEKIKT